MEILIGKTAGFCFGVKNAVEKTIEELEKNKKIYCLGELVHNTKVTQELIYKGAEFIDEIEKAKTKVIIRAHGVPKSVYEKAKELNLEIIDLTCPKVLHIHNIAKDYKEKEYFIFVIGQKDHPETIGTISFCGKHTFLIENIDDIEEAISKYNKSGLKNTIVFAQTTFSIEKFQKIVNVLKEKTNNLEVKNTICNATRQRQEETSKMAKEVDAMIIIGGKHSSNTTKLFEIASQNCKNVFFVEDKDELDISKIKNISKIGIMAGASTPQKSIDEIVEVLEKI